MCERGKSDRARTFLGGMIAFNKRNSTWIAGCGIFRLRARESNLPMI